MDQRKNRIAQKKLNGKKYVIRYAIEIINVVESRNIMLMRYITLNNITAVFSYAKIVQIHLFVVRKIILYSTIDKGSSKVDKDEDISFLDKD